MAFVIPDTVLEQLNCDSCFKFLSVKPVKVYPNRKTLCGRCCQDDDGGVVSLFGLIAENSLFKCVNRLDGCRKLFTYAMDVVDHEKSCVAVSYRCPLCEGCELISTYLLLQHVERKHRKHLLKKNSFVIELSDHYDIFFHRIGYTIFCLEFELRSERGYLMVRARPMCKTNIETEQRFILNYGKEHILSKRKNIYGSFHSFHESNEFHFQLQDLYKYPFVNVEFDIIPQLEIFQISEMFSVLPNRNDTNETECDQEIVFCIMNDGQNTKWQPRKVFLTEEFQKLFPGLRVNNKGDGIRSLEDQLDVIPYCMNCQEISQSEDDYNRGFFYKNPEYSFICFFCYQIKKDSDVRSLKLHTYCFEYWIYEKIEYFCRWDCGNTFTNGNIIEHESECSHQLLQNCPVENCNHKGTLEKLKCHFQESHKSRVINGQKYLFSLLTQSKFSIGSSHCSRSQKMCFIYYIWLLNVFVRVVISWNHQYQTDFEVNVSVCGDQCTDIHPRVLMFYSTATKFFSTWSHVYPK